MTSSSLSNHEIEVSDVEFLRHGGKPLLARVSRPRGDGPYPLMIALHGGAWCRKDRTANTHTEVPLAKSGVVVVSPDFRMPPDAGYPASLVDINYAIRWFKANAAKFNSRPDLVGIIGFSSGGHQAMLAAMRPADPRYAAIALPEPAAVDATVRCAVLCWPVIDPLGRYQHAQKLKAEGNSRLFESVGPDHISYWGDEAAMAEGNPTRALERGESVQMPPVLYLQGTNDSAHPRPHLERFVEAYRKAGGLVELHWFEGMGQTFIPLHPDSPQAKAAIEKIIEFVHREIR